MSKRKTQMNFFSEMGEDQTPKREYGGSLPAGELASRPLDRDKALHLVFRSSRAKGTWSFRASPERDLALDDVIRSSARRCGVQIDKIGNVGTRIHVLVQFSTRRGVETFIRLCRVGLAREATSTSAPQKIGAFWDSIPYSRIVDKGKDYAMTRRYVELSEIQGASGLLTRAHFADEWAQKPWWLFRVRQNEADAHEAIGTINLKRAAEQFEKRLADA